jgi:protein TonB
MQNVSISRQDTTQRQHAAVRKKPAAVIALKSFGGERVPAHAMIPATGGGAGLGVFQPGPGLNDRKWLDALIGVALVAFIHATVIERFKHRPEPEILPPKKTEVEISLLRPAPPPPPPPPPVVQPRPKPAPVKDAIPPKPKPKPKKQPPPAVERPPVKTEAPVSNDAPPAPVQAAPAPAPAPAPPVEKVVKLTGADYLRNPPPEYPDDALDRGWQGKVLLKVRILPTGKPDVVQVHKSSGHASLDSAAVRTVKRNWLFKPGLQDASATAVWVIIPITFQL